jgi:hypothetical protein
MYAHFFSNKYVTQYAYESTFSLHNIPIIIIIIIIICICICIIIVTSLILFVVYLTTLSVAQSIQRRVIMNDER